MRKLFFGEKEFARIMKLKKRIEKYLDIKIKVENKKTIIIENKKKDQYMEYISSKILEAISLGFDLDIAFQLKDINFNFIKIDIKNFVRESRLNDSISRVIGTKGKTKKLISELSDCDIIVHEHIVAVIGPSDNVEVANQALISLIRGSKPSKIYSFLERSREQLRKLSEENIGEIIEEERIEKNEKKDKIKDKDKK
jgi:KH domain-containing protein